jgi:hypothetical protein
LEKLRPFLTGALASPADALERRIQQVVALIQGCLDVGVVVMAAATCELVASGRTATKKSVSTSTARKCGSRRRDQKSRAHNDWNIPSHLLVSLGHLIFHGQKGCAPEFGSWSQITLAAPFPRPEDIRQADCHINDHLPINFSQFYRSASMPSRTSHEEPYDGHSRNDIGFNPLIGGAREGVLNETRSHRTFYRRSHRFRACCACARCIKQDTRP